MEAYNAYYNNHEQSPAKQEGENKSPNQSGEGKRGNIVNNIMNLNNSGVNINITAAAGCQNNFIFCLAITSGSIRASAPT